MNDEIARSMTSSRRSQPSFHSGQLLLMRSLTSPSHHSLDNIPQKVTAFPRCGLAGQANSGQAIQGRPHRARSFISMTKTSAMRWLQIMDVSISIYIKLIWMRLCNDYNDGKRRPKTSHVRLMQGFWDRLRQVAAPKNRNWGGKALQKSRPLFFSTSDSIKNIGRDFGKTSKMAARFIPNVNIPPETRIAVAKISSQNLVPSTRFALSSLSLFIYYKLVYA